jgi:putative transcriptional regulator
MTGKVADSIRRGLEEALAYAEGTADVSRYGVHIPEAIDVKAIRAKLDAYLLVIERNPKAVQKALRAA